MATSKRRVKVYDVNGKEYEVDNLNGHDMVMHLGYTYTPGKVFTPADTAPHALVGKKPTGIKTQEILNNVGHSLGQSPALDVEPDEEEDEDEVVETTAAAVVDLPPVVAPEEKGEFELPPTSEASLRGKPGRKPKA